MNALRSLGALGAGLLLVPALAGLLSAQDDDPAALRALIERLDKNGDRVLERDEVAEPDRADFERLLKRGDRNQNGRLETEELRALIRPVGPEAKGKGQPGAGGFDPERRIAAMDRDGDGKVSREEFTGPPRLFDRLDADHDGFISKAEAKDARRVIAGPQRKVGPPRSSVGLVPLNELGTGRYQGEQGGLYPDGSNRRPDTHEQAGLRLARAVRPLDRDGKPADDGKIVLLSIGMSNTTQEFSTFKPLADADPAKNPRLVIVDGAQGGMDAPTIVHLERPRGQTFWRTVEDRLQKAGATPAQVQAAWVKEAIAGPSETFPEDAKVLERDLERIAQILKEKFPNLRLAYYSSRIYAGYATTPLNPEPCAYQSGFAVKWLVARQIEGAPELNYDPDRGPVKAPWLAWGPYLWADGTKPRSDGLTYTQADLAADGTHPSPSGRQKVAKLLLEFFKTDSTTKPWFLGGG